MKLDKAKIDSSVEDNGDWVESPEFPGVFAKVRSIRNPDFRRAQQTEMRKARRKYGNQPIPVDVEEQITSRLVADHVLLDIDGLEDENDQPINLTRDFAVELMTNRDYRKLADFVVWAASVVGEDMDDDMEADAKNS